MLDLVKTAMLCLTGFLLLLGLPFIACSGVVPLGVAFLATGACLGICVVLARVDSRQRRRRTTNCCLHCGYDLRGSAGRCPECGEWRSVQTEDID